MVMRDINRCESVILADTTNLGAHLQPEPGVEVGKWLVEKHTTGADHQSPGKGHALLLTAGELSDFPFRIRTHLHGFQRGLDPLADFRLGNAPFLQSEGDIFGHRHVRPEGVTLKHHPRVALVGRQCRHILFAKENTALVGKVKAGDIAKKCRFSTSAGPEEKKQLAGFDAEGNAIQRHRVTEFFNEFVDGDRDHGLVEYQLRQGGSPGRFRPLLLRSSSWSLSAEARELTSGHAGDG